MPARLVIALDPDRLAAVSGSSESGRVHVRAWIDVARPASVDAADAKSYAAWLSSELERAGIEAKRAYLALPRSGVVLKRLRLPAPDDQRPGELASMVALQMSRQLASAPGESVIDYTVLPSRDATRTEVLAGALPAARLGFARDVAEHADLKLAGVVLRTAGVGALLREDTRGREGATLAIALRNDSAEYLTFDAGEIVHSREADLTHPPEHNDPLDGFSRDEWLADQAVVEAKRSWMTQRTSDDTPPIERAVVLGDDDLASRVAQRCSEELGVHTETFAPPASWTLPREQDDASFTRLAPLVGLLLHDERRLDFAHPTRAPDRGAELRRRAGLVAAMLLVVGLLGWMVAGRALAGLKSDLGAAQQAERTARERYVDALLDDARARHAEAWLGANPDWLAEIGGIHAHLPGRGEALLDTIEGVLDASVMYKPARKRYLGADDTWSARSRVLLPVAGSVRERAVADALRERLIESGRYDVTSGAPDDGQRFDLDLATREVTP